jgi:alkanesulfonate monooxygenase SsuD/methylene tetrahydromethanopterin reductase-like flavin-dependent oxidoreductase (luciferase family)
MPPLLVGGRSPAAIERAARFADGWLSMLMSPQAVSSAGTRLREQAHRLGRRSPELMMSLMVHVDKDRSHAVEEAGAFVRGQYGMEFGDVERWAALGGVNEVADQVSAYLEAGVKSVVLIPVARDPLHQLECFVKVRAVVEG